MSIVVPIINRINGFINSFINPNPIINDIIFKDIDAIINIVK